MRNKTLKTQTPEMWFVQGDGVRAMDLSGLLLNPILKLLMQNSFCFSLLGLPGAEPSARDAVVGTSPCPDPSQEFHRAGMTLQSAEHISWDHPILSVTPTELPLR